MTTGPAKGAALDILQGVRRRLAFASAWHNTVHAMDAAGREVAPANPNATRWSLSGAIIAEAAAQRLTTSGNLAATRNHLARHTGVTDMEWSMGNLDEWAAKHGHARTMALLDRAINGVHDKWQGGGALEDAAELVTEALAYLDTNGHRCKECGSMRFDNPEHARLHAMLSELPEKLRKAARRGAETATNTGSQHEAAERS